MSTLAEMVKAVAPDPWRVKVNFTAEVAHANHALWSESPDNSVKILKQWVGEFQPCIFGRIAAKLDLLSYCILTERDLQDGDEAIAAKIAKARTAWMAEGFEGKKSGFIILLVSKPLALAEPSLQVQEIARRLCSLYLRSDI